jgi:hypothetical protein
MLFTERPLTRDEIGAFEAVLDALYALAAAAKLAPALPRQVRGG